MLKNNNSKYKKARQYFTAQAYIEAEYPKLIQKNIKKLDISNLDLPGELDLSNFTKLEELNCANNLLTRLDLSGCVNLKKLNGDGNDNLKVFWSKKVENQVRYSTLGLSAPLSLQEIREAKIKKQRRQGGIIPDSALWNTIHPNFTLEVSQSWKNLGFAFEETNDWIKAGFTPNDLELCVWVRDIKKIRAIEVLKGEVADLRKEFKHWQEGAISMSIEIQTKKYE